MNNIPSFEVVQHIPLSFNLGFQLTVTFRTPLPGRHIILCCFHCLSGLLLWWFCWGCAIQWHTASLVSRLAALHAVCLLRADKQHSPCSDTFITIIGTTTYIPLQNDKTPTSGAVSTPLCHHSGMGQYGWGPICPHSVETSGREYISMSVAKNILQFRKWNTVFISAFYSSP